ncbi:MAG TPA: hypothetical protein VD994_21185 [Prosthecobacter sp.]|nr:hypothetical protein [Prosthecobacter sp.]
MRRKIFIERFRIPEAGTGADIRLFPNLRSSIMSLSFIAQTVVAAFFISSGMAAEMMPNDSRLWEQTGKAVIITDLSKAEPAVSLTKGQREKGKWKTIPYATADMKGWALSAYAFTKAPTVGIPLQAKGWHAVYLGVSTVSTGFREAKNGVQAKLGSEPFFKRMANNLALIMPSRIDVIQEQFISVANLNGDSLQIAQMPNLPTTVCYIKLVPLSTEEVTMWSAKYPEADKKTRTAIATFDGHSWLWPYECRTEEDLMANFRGYENSDIGKWWFQVLGADLVIYPSKVGAVPGANTVDFPTREHASFANTIKELHKAGINPLKVAREAARAQGAEFHIMLRPAGWKACIPYEETFDSPFYTAHPEWRCVDRDGTPTMYMSHAFLEVRKHLLDIYRETLELQPEGVGLLFNRGMPMMLWEQPFLDRFKQMHNGADARQVPEDDPRIYATRAAIMTDFIREIRALLDETAKAQGRTQRYRISLGTFSKEADNQKFGFDLPLWIKEGLVDDLGIAWFAHHTSFAQPDMAYYTRLTKGTEVGVYPFVIAWKTGKAEDFCKNVTSFYKAGATGIAVWDPHVETPWTDKPHGNSFEAIAKIGHRDIMARWAKNGVPLPLSIPLTQLDENHYSRWFPTTGF